MAVSPVHELTDRARDVFRVVVESYLGTGAPVGSRTISKLGQMNLSPASIRNTMQDLTQLGLLLPTPPSLQAALEAADRREAGFVMRDVNALLAKKKTVFTWRRDLRPPTQMSCAQHAQEDRCVQDQACRWVPGLCRSTVGAMGCAGYMDEQGCQGSAQCAWQSEYCAKK